MPRDRHGDEHVARAARSGHALAAQAHGLAIGDSGRNLDLDVLAGRQPHALGDAMGGFRQRHGQRRADVGSGRHVLGLETGAAGTPAPATSTTEGLAQNVLEPAETPAARRGAGTAAPCPAGKALRAEVESLEFGVRTEAARMRPPALAESFKPLEARLAFGVDFAAVERLALVVVAQNLVGGVDLGKAPRRLGIVLVGVGMQFFGQAPESALDVGCIGLAINAQHFIGITHPHGLRSLCGALPQVPRQLPEILARNLLARNLAQNLSHECGAYPTLAQCEGGMTAVVGRLKFGRQPADGQSAGDRRLNHA